MKFSICIIAKNEEKTLPNLLNSIKGVEDVCLVDTGSTDKTIEVAKSFGVRVFEQNFSEVITAKMAYDINRVAKQNGETDIVKENDVIFNFAKARNWIAQQAKNDLIFCPDCDEVLDWDLKQVEEILEVNPDKVEYNYIFSFDKDGNPIYSFINSKFYNRKKAHWEGLIHECIVAKDKNDYDNNVEGWTSQKELSFLHETAKEMETIVEIGSWKGRSTEALLSGTKGTVYAVDHFLGSKGEELQHKEAKDDVVYNQFMDSVGHYKNLKVLRMSSNEAVKQFADKSVDMVFIDGEHTYEGVKEDIKLWLPKAKKIICGHDYCDAWAGVKKAVEENFDDFTKEDSIWIKNLDGQNRGPFKTLQLPKEILLLKHYQNAETNRGGYLKGLAFDSIQTNYNDRNCHYYGRELMYTKRYKTAIDIFKRHIDREGWKKEQAQSLVYIGDCYLALGNIEEAKKSYAYAQVKDPNRREPFLALADLYYNNKQWAEAGRLYRLSLYIPKNDYYGNVESNYGHWPLGQLSVCLFYQGRKDESLEYLKKALELSPDNEVYINNLTFYK
jgi:tetratricopeptide (TPR) repeat protein